MNSLVSIILPTYNSGRFLSDAIKSILNQSHSNLEIIILDDFSSDNTISIIEGFVDNRIIIFKSNQNFGQSYQLNKGIALATGAYISIMHSDDLMHIKKIEKQLFFLADNPSIDICGCNIHLIGEKNDVWNCPEKNQDCRDLLLTTVPFAHPTILFRKSILAKSYIYNEEFFAAEDYDLWVKIAKNVSFGNVQLILFSYRTHPNQISYTKKNIENEIIDKVRKNVISFLFNIEKKYLFQCFKTLYYSEELNIKDTLFGAYLLYKSNKKSKFFSDKVLNGKLKHIIYKKLSSVPLNKRIYHLLKNFNFLVVAFFTTSIRSIFKPSSN